jgi:hypothetical protein
MMRDDLGANTDTETGSGDTNPEVSCIPGDVAIVTSQDILSVTDTVCIDGSLRIIGLDGAQIELPRLASNRLAAPSRRPGISLLPETMFSSISGCRR